MALIPLAVFGAWYMALRQHYIPSPITQVWFGITLAVNAVAAAVCTTLIHGFSTSTKLISKRRSEALCKYVSSVFWFIMIKLNPQIHISCRNVEKGVAWANIEPNACVLVNHVSIFDAMLIVYMCPWKNLSHIKCLIKASLFKIPIVGASFHHMGHFPVHFVSNESEEFRTNKEAQANISDMVLEHMRWGQLCLFPEGRINPDAKTLLPFRLGTISLMLKNSTPIYYFVATNTNKTWPTKAQIGGRNADIECRFGRFECAKDYSKYASVEELEVAMRGEMTRVLNELTNGSRSS
jgi:1-acyl-sn-glycerol-3-phosphate acyltransferase